MRRAFLILPIFFLSQVWALECKAPAQLRQAEGKDQTLLSWCEVDGLKSGPFEQFSVKNSLEVRANYMGGKLDGEFKRFWPDGRINTEGAFSDGKMSGTWTRYDKDGTLRDQGTWLNDKPSGSWKYFDAKGEMTREVSFDGEGKMIRAPDKPLRTGDSWRLRFGLSRADAGDQQGNSIGPMIGVDRRLFQLGRWLRSELLARVVTDRIRNSSDNNGNDNGAHSGLSGQLALGFEPIPYWLDPFAFTIRAGPEFIGISKSKLAVGFGLLYQWSERRPGFHISGAFTEFAGVVDGDNGGNGGGNNYCGSGPGSNCNGGNGNHSGADILSVGVLFTL